MRVLAMVSRDPRNPALGGGEVVMAEFAKALVHDGYEVDLVCASFPGGAAEDVMDGVRVHRIAPETVLGAAAYADYRRRYRGRVDVILEEFLGGSRIPFAAPLYAREPVVSLWFQDHLPVFRYEYPGWLFPALAGLERGLLWAHRRSAFLVDSAAAEAGLVAKGVAQDRIRVFHPGLPQATLRLGPPRPAREREPQLVCLGKIRRYKSQHHAILVLQDVSRAVPTARLIIAGRVGDPGYLEEMRRLTRASGLEDRVAFEIGVTEDRKIELFRTSRVALSPSPIEGFGMAVTEASACGVPVIGTTGIPEDSLREGVNGFRVPFGDVRAMADRAHALLTDDALVDRLGASAHAFAARFTWESAAAPLRDLLHDLPAKR